MSAVIAATLALGVPDADATRDLRVMTFNVRYGTAPDGTNAWPQRKEFLFETIRAFDPDLLGTQEVLNFQRDDLAAALRDHDVFAAGRDDGRDAGEMAAIFYRKARFERLDGGHFWLSETPEVVGSTGWDAALPRLCTWVKLRDRNAPEGAPPLVHFNAHYDHRGRVACHESSKLLRRKAAELGRNARIVVTGDFNSADGSTAYRNLFSGDSPRLFDAFRVAHPEPRPQEEGTFSGFRPGPNGSGRIDWIGVNDRWEVLSSEIDRTSRDGRTPSDHFPVTAALRPADPPAAAPGTLRVLCYNIHHGEGTDGKVDLDRIARVINDARPDLVALQEVDDRTGRTGGVDQTAELARLTGLEGRFGKAIDYQGGGYGQAVLSRFPIEATAVHLLPGTPDRERRIAFKAVVRTGGGPLTFVTTHLHHQNPEFRAQQAAEINALFGRDEGPVVLAGDLNATPGSPPLEALGGFWSVAGGDESLFTYPSSGPSKRIDYVLHRPVGRFRVVSARVPEEPVASDHRPLLVILERDPG